MTFYKSFSLLAAVFLPVMFLQVNAFQTENHDNHQDETQPLNFTVAQMKMADIKIAQLTPRFMDKRLYAPGEVQANGYTSYVVSSRVESVILRRHAILGEHVKQGQALVTLFSENVAQAQALYRIAYAEWQRAKKIGNSVISESKLLSIETDYMAAYSRLKAYGLSQKAIEYIGKNNSSALGEYTLNAERAGSVLSDDFQQGQRVTPGDTIMVLTDETELWVEARLAANNRVALSKGTKAQVVLSGSEQGKSMRYEAQVIQQAHTIDPKTRTRIVRLKVKNNNHQLHPGLFVDVYFTLLTKTPILVVPESALLRGADGDWQIYTTPKNNDAPLDMERENTPEAIHKEDVNREETEHAHDKGDTHVHEELDNGENQIENSEQTIPLYKQASFIAQEVELGAVFRVYSPSTKQWVSWREISGVKAESHYAITGAFFIASQEAKSGFDAHNH